MATVKELRELTGPELVARAAELKQTLFDLKNKASTGVLDSTAELLKTRREVARCLTVARQKAQAAGKAKE
jgi:large subunit ribosomal protein L29